MQVGMEIVLISFSGGRRGVAKKGVRKQKYNMESNQPDYSRRELLGAGN